MAMERRKLLTWVRVGGGIGISTVIVGTLLGSDGDFTPRGEE